MIFSLYLLIAFILWLIAAYLQGKYNFVALISKINNYPNHTVSHYNIEEILFAFAFLSLLWPIIFLFLAIYFIIVYLFAPILYFLCFPIFKLGTLFHRFGKNAAIVKNNPKIISNCCGIPYTPKSNLCPCCNEPCEWLTLKECPECGTQNTFSNSLKAVICPICQGDLP